MADDKTKPAGKDTKPEDKASATEPKPGLDPTSGAEKVAALESDKAKLEGELAKYAAKVAELGRENSELRANVRALQKENATLESMVPVQAPKGAARLLESTVVFRHDVGGTRGYAKRGDVLLIEANSEQVAAAQRQVGQSATVFSVTKAAVEELHKHGQVEPC